jgi:hypothetical protein
MNYKVGDWVIIGYKIVQITRIEDNRVTSFSDGNFSTSGWEFEVFPLTLSNKRAAETAEYYMNKLHKSKGSTILNFPDLNRAFESLAADVYRVEENLRGPAYATIEKFYKDVCEAQEKIMETTIQGVRVFERF